LVGRRNAASSRCAISARLFSSFCEGRTAAGCARFGSAVTGDWNTGSWTAEVGASEFQADALPSVWNIGS
jgi:hypothetical protein